jgi:PilZ domain
MAVALLHESTLVDEVGLDDRAVEPNVPLKDRRSGVRLSAEDASWLRGARLKYGPEVRVIDVSTGGILVESEPLEPGANIVFELSGPKGTVLVPSRVLRSRAITNGLKPSYHVACAFKRPLSIETLDAVAKDQASAIPSRAAAPSPSSSRASWQRVVARFRNGKLVRGYTNDFHPSKAHLHLTPEDGASDPIFVATTQLKAVFFVRDFAGDPTRVDRNEFKGASSGRKIEVTFQDGEVLLGTTLAYREGGGFFVHPADAGSNNMRVFVAPGATLHVRFL